jgi:hypothetical protein
MTTGNIQPSKQTTNVPNSGQQVKNSVDTKPVDKDKQRRRNTWIIAISISVVISLIIGIAYYLIYVMPFQRTFIQVDDDVVKIDYFLKRALNSSSESPIWDTMNALVEELIVMQEAPKSGIEVTDADIDTILRDAAKGDSESLTDAEFEEWYRQLLNNSQLSDKQYRDYVKRTLMRQKMAQLLADNTPSFAEQSHLWIIVVKTYDEAVAVKERIDNGEEFASLARELSLDTATGPNGGDIGWLPLGLLEDRFLYVITGLDIGKCSEPAINTMATETTDTSGEDTTDYALLMVSERDVAREVLPEQLEYLKAKAYNDWLNAQMETKTISFHGLHGGGYDSETDAWLSYQLERLKKGTSSTTEE